MDQCPACQGKAQRRRFAAPLPWFDRALREDAFTCWFQPIVDLSSAVVFAHECLIRLDDGDLRTGKEIIQAALVCGSIHSFDAYARQLAIREGRLQHEPGTYLFVNCFPASVHDPECCLRSTVEAVQRTSLRPSDIVFEMVDADSAPDYDRLRRLCDFYRREGFGVALDDVMGGAESLNRVADLGPHFIKLDKILIQRADAPAVVEMIREILDVARDYHIAVIAKDVEAPETAAALLATGISLMQGRHFGRPSPQMRANTGAALLRLMEHLEGHLEAEMPQSFAPLLTDL